MNFLLIKFLPLILLFLIIFSIACFQIRSRFAQLIYDYWFLKLSLWNKLSFMLNFLGLSIMLFALLDLRGPEDKISAQIPDQKTIIMIDTSASMLSDDVRPSRFQKAILMARHFVKNAAGHQISVVIFSDIQKQIVPFTDDIDLLEARIEGLGSLKLRHGGSNISQALAEVKNYFQTATGRSTGNVLLFTDGEEGNNKFKIDDPGITLAVVGIGTVQGGRIPLRDKYNKFIGYKKYQGREVVTKLNENFFKMLGKSFKTYRYWIAQSYSIPTEEILQFFRTNFVKSNVKGEVIIRPVLGDRLLKIGIIFICLGVILRFFKSFSFVVLLIVMVQFCTSISVFAKEQKTEISSENKLQQKLQHELEPYLQRLKHGELSRQQILKMAEFYLRLKQWKKANTIYDEAHLKIDRDELSVLYNSAVATALSGRIADGIDLLHELLIRNPDEKFRKLVSSTVLKLVLEEKKQQKKKQQKNKDKKQQKNKNKNKKQGNNSKNKQDKKQSKKQDKNERKQQKGKSKDKQDKKSKQRKDNKRDNKNNQENKSKSKQQHDDKKQQQKQKSSKPKTIEQKEREIRQKRRMVKVPTILKKILSDDRKLQEQYIDTKTDKRSRKRQDW